MYLNIWHRTPSVREWILLTDGNFRLCPRWAAHG